MKSTTPFITSIIAASCLGCASSYSQNWNDRLYLNLDFGPSIIQDATSHYRALFQGNIYRFKGKFEAAPGTRSDLSLGYNLTKSFAVELELGGIWNPSRGSDDSFYQIPTMVNAVYQIHFHDRWKAYMGAGAGAVTSIAETVLFDGASVHPRFRTDDTDTAFGYQAEGGIKYSVSRHAEIGLGYKFLGVNGYQYHFQTGPFPADASNMRINSLFTHSAQLSLTWKF